MKKRRSGTLEARMAPKGQSKERDADGINTKYLLNLDKRHFKQSVIAQPKAKDEKFVKTDKEILNQREAFYKILYA